MPAKRRRKASGSPRKPYKQLWFKVLNKPRYARYSGHRWPKEGEWTDRIPAWELEMCQRGWHLAPSDGLTWWISRPLGYDHVWLAEARGRGKHEYDKSVFPSARLVRYLGRMTRQMEREIDGLVKRVSENEKLTRDERLRRTDRIVMKIFAKSKRKK